MDSLSDVWRRAGQDLGVKVVAPFSAVSGRRTLHFHALVPDFGGGIVVASLPYDRRLIADAKAIGFQCSFVNPEFYFGYSRDRFIDTLREWGYTGPADTKPGWLEQNHD